MPDLPPMELRDTVRSIESGDADGAQVTFRESPAVLKLPGERRDLVAVLRSSMDDDRPVDVTYDPIAMEIGSATLYT